MYMSVWRHAYTQAAGLHNPVEAGIERCSMTIRSQDTPDSGYFMANL